MIINKGKFQIAQISDDDYVVIFRNKELIKRIPARPNLSYNELEKVLYLYAGTEATSGNNE